MCLNLFLNWAWSGQVIYYYHSSVTSQFKVSRNALEIWIKSVVSIKFHQQNLYISAFSVGCQGLDKRDATEAEKNLSAGKRTPAILQSSYPLVPEGEPMLKCSAAISKV